jgi:hypothetical protein
MKISCSPKFMYCSISSMALQFGCTFEMHKISFGQFCFISVSARYMYYMYINDTLLLFCLLLCHVYMCVVTWHLLSFLCVLSVQWPLRPLPVLSVLRCPWLVSRVPLSPAGTPHSRAPIQPGPPPHRVSFSSLQSTNAKNNPKTPPHISPDIC